MIQTCPQPPGSLETFTHPHRRCNFRAGSLKIRDGLTLLTKSFPSAYWYFQAVDAGVAPKTRGREALAWVGFPSHTAWKENHFHGAEVHADADVAGKGQGEVMLSACSASASDLAWAACAQDVKYGCIGYHTSRWGPLGRSHHFHAPSSADLP